MQIKFKFLLICSFLHFSCNKLSQKDILNMQSELSDSEHSTVESNIVKNKLILRFTCRKKIVGLLCKNLKSHQNQELLSWYIAYIRNTPYRVTDFLKQDSRYKKQLNGPLVEHFKCRLRKCKILDKDKNKKGLRRFVEDVALGLSDGDKIVLDTQRVIKEKEAFIEEIINILARGMVDSLDKTIRYNDDFFKIDNWEKLGTVEEVRKFIDCSKSPEFEKYVRSETGKLFKEASLDLSDGRSLEFLQDMLEIVLILAPVVPIWLMLSDLLLVDPPQFHPPKAIALVVIVILQQIMSHINYYKT